MRKNNKVIDVVCSKCNKKKTAITHMTLKNMLDVNVKYVCIDCCE